MYKKYFSLRGRCAFSILELALVLVVISGLYTIFFNNVSIDAYKARHTHSQVEVLEDVIYAYWSEYKRLPCPAAFGISDGAEVGSCHSTCPSGLHCSLQSNGDVAAAIGAVPYIELGIERPLSIDSWGNQIGYAVSAIFTKEYGDTRRAHSGFPGLIKVIDINGNTLSSEASFVIFSYGTLGKGGYKADGAINAVCDTTTNEGENCNNDSIFRFEQINTKAGSGYYDDILRYGYNKDVSGCITESGACVFHLDTSDFATFREDAGTNVITHWYDKGITKSEAKNPTSNTALLTESSVQNWYSEFDFSNSIFSFNHMSIPTTDCTIIVVFRPSMLGADQTIVAMTDGVKYDREIQINGVGEIIYTLDDNSLHTINTLTTVNPGRKYIVTIIMDSNSISPATSIYINRDSKITYTAAYQSSVSASKVTIGGRGNADYYSGRIMEIIMLDKVLSDSERKKLEGALSKKWNSSLIP